ncbi:MAG: NUDIX hydrolase [Acidimicrobiales bacterium]
MALPPPEHRSPPSRPEMAVGAVVVHDGRLLLIRRGRGPAAGQWSVPGGRVEWGETLAQAVEREVAEETGLAVRCGSFVGWVERMGQGHHYVIMDFRAEVVGGPGMDLRAGDDAAEAAWVPLEEVPSVDLVEGMLSFLRIHRIIV